jgi:mRNA interferase HicA
MTSAELKRWLEKLGATFEPAKGGHLRVFLNGRQSIVPMHGSRKELKAGTVHAIKKQLGLK